MTKENELENYKFNLDNYVKLNRGNEMPEWVYAMTDDLIEEVFGQADETGGFNIDGGNLQHLVWEGIKKYNETFTQPLPVDRQLAIIALDNLIECFDDHCLNYNIETMDQGGNDVVPHHIKTIRQALSETPEERARRLHPPIALSKPNDEDVEGLKLQLWEQCKKDPMLIGDQDTVDWVVDYFIDNNYLSQPKEEWRDIDSAPKDGMILGYIPTKKGRGGYKSYQVICSKDEDEEISMQNEPYFYCDSGDFHFPTHWMPLPNPPNAQQEDK